MANTIKITQELEQTQLLREMTKQHAAFAKSIDKMQQMGRAGRRAGNQTAGGFSQATRQAQLMVGALTGIGSVAGGIALIARQLRKELDNIRQRQGIAKETQLEIAAAERGALGNLPKDVSGDELRKQVESIADQTGARRSGLFQAIGGALSFKEQTLTKEDAFAAVRTAAQIEPGDQDALESISKAILAQQGQTGGTARQIAGFQLGVKRESPVSTNEDFARNIAPAIANLIDFGDTAREAGALLATIGQGAKDPEGRITRNASINFAKQLKQLLPTTEGGTLGRLKFLQSDAGTMQRRKLLGGLEVGATQAEKGGLTGQAKAFTTLVALLQQGQNKQKTLLEANLKAIPKLADGAAALENFLAKVRASPFQRQAEFARTFSTGAEGLSASDFVGAQGAISREGFGKLLQAGGVGKTSQQLKQFGFEFESRFGEKAPIKTVSQALKQQASFLTRTENVENVSAGVGARGFISRSPHTPTDRDLESAKVFRNVAKKLDALITIMKTQQKGNRPQKVEVINNKNTPRTPNKNPSAELSRN